jgi:hypothetical protein
LEQSRISERSSQRSTSGASSVSVRCTALRAMSTAAASWSKERAMPMRSFGSAFHTPAVVVTRMRRRPDECW